jgi:hypothetical protein
LATHVGWGEPSSAAKPHGPVPEALKPLLHECYAMYDLLLPYALSPVEVQPMLSPTASIAARLSATGVVSGAEDTRKPADEVSVERMTGLGSANGGTSCGASTPFT